ncbi:MAG TPA: ribbon-helix-helix protein, CopG family [Candidatus Lokiarchaeia archaeon]|nr:ribbon-helix-helix protein, CopG family [Candidatus Lokiarchaeia archaeon]
MSTISTRLDEEVLKNIEKLASEMNLDRSALIRKFILDGYHHAMLRKNIELVHDGELSIEQAAERSRVPVNRVIEAAREMNIEIGADASTIEHEKAVLEKHVNKSRN